MLHEYEYDALGAEVGGSVFGVDLNIDSNGHFNPNVPLDIILSAEFHAHITYSQIVIPIKNAYGKS